VRYYIKSQKLNGRNKDILDEEVFKKMIIHVIDEGAIRYCPDEYEKFIKKQLKPIVGKKIGDFDEEEEDF
jgi:hypothetical protein